MKCRSWNEHIALYVEGDLQHALARQLEAHLEDCVECRSFAAGLRETQVEIRELLKEPIEATSLDRIRMNVLQQVRTIEERRSWLDRAAMGIWGGFRWRSAILGGFVAVSMAIMIWHASSPVALPPPSIATAPQLRVEDHDPVPVAAAMPVKVAPRKHPPVKPVVSPAVAAADKGEEARADTVVQILTDDPNVVIYWLIDQTGGQ